MPETNSSLPTSITVLKGHSSQPAQYDQGCFSTVVFVLVLVQA